MRGRIRCSIASVDPYIEGCGGYLDRGVEGATRCAVRVAGEGVGRMHVDSEIILAAGERLRQNILVNYAHDVATPGNYEIHAVNVSSTRPITGEVSSSRRLGVQSRGNDSRFGW